MNLTENTTQVAVLRVLSDDVNEALREDKTELITTMAEDGIEKVAARLPDGTKVATLTYVGGEGAPRAQVDDNDALVAWMEANRPDEVEVVKTVRPQTLKAIIDAANTHGAAMDPKTGERIPGIGFGTGTPYIQVKFVKGRQPGEGGRDLIREAWRSGLLQAPDPRTLPAGGDGDA
jgi:hypothetical protein